MTIATSIRRHAAVLLGLAIAACHSPTVPSSSNTPGGGGTSSPVPPPAPTRSVSGQVVAVSAAGAVPMPGVDVSIWLEQPRFGQQAGRVRTDSDGRFSLSAPADAIVRLFAAPAGYQQPCLATVPLDASERTIRLVAMQDLPRIADLPGAIEGPVLTGEVYEMTSAGRRSVAAADVELDGLFGMGLLLADTVTQTDGRYLLCGLEGSAEHTVVVFKEGYQISYVGAPRSGVLDIELRAISR